jgi:hypothetical protein
MKTIIFLALAASLPALIRGQNARAQWPPQATRSVQGPQARSGDTGQDDLVFPDSSLEDEGWARSTALARNPGDLRAMKAFLQLKFKMAQRDLAGTKFCGEHVVNGATFVDEIAESAHGMAFALRWLDREPGITVHTAITTSMGRCVAIDGLTLRDGKSILAVMPNSLAISSQHGLIAYEAEYSPSRSGNFNGGGIHRGLFVEDHWVADLDSQKASPPFGLALDDAGVDFRWGVADEKLEIKPGVAIVSVTQAPPARPSAQTAVPQAQRPAASPTPASRQSAQNACDASKTPARKPRFGGVALPDSVTKALQKLQSPCPVGPASGQGAKQ